MMAKDAMLSLWAVLTTVLQCMLALAWCSLFSAWHRLVGTLDSTNLRKSFVLHLGDFFFFVNFVIGSSVPLSL